MQFFECEVELTKKLEIDSESRGEWSGEVQTATGVLFEDSDRSCYVILTRVSANLRRLTLCAATRNATRTEPMIRQLLKKIEIDHRGISSKEVTFNAYMHLLSLAMRRSFIADSNAVLEAMGLSFLDCDMSYRRDFSESLCEGGFSQEELLMKARGLLCDNELPQEIQRIYMGRKRSRVQGHPVHYTFQFDDTDASDEALRLVLNALYDNGRLTSPRYSELNLERLHNISPETAEKFYRFCAGTAVVVSLLHQNGDAGGYVSGDHNMLSLLYRMAQKYRNSVLTIIRVPRSYSRDRDGVIEELEGLSFVTFREINVEMEQASAYLIAQAKAHNIRPNKRLYRGLKPDKGYSSQDLTLMFSNWYDHELRTKVFSQYADLDPTAVVHVDKRAKGSAYDQLIRMVGLTTAKEMIYQVLDYHKAQKLFCEKGIKDVRPAMHMVFTGNPGTAKTTVARLFAQIMKDNNLLSVGNLYEVGRGDLVGRYVGWTAPTVQAKFRQAKGSVLFIDEAYSLVDDREGLYGDEAINTIVQEMENMREDIVVIFAGYPDKMEGFLQKNPGLRSRIAFHIPFEDYSVEELCNIAHIVAEGQGLKLDDSVKEKLMLILEQAVRQEDFGNGRYVRNLVEKAVMKQSSRLVSLGTENVLKEDLELLIADDFEAPPQTKPARTRVGF